MRLTLPSPTKLREIIAEEAILWKARETIERPGKDNKWFTAEQAIPCILHLRMRVMETLLSDLVMSGWSRYEAGVDSKIRKAYMSAMEKAMNMQVLGNVDSPDQWKFPKVEKAKKGGGYFLTKKGITGGNARKALLGLEPLICCTFAEAHDECAWEQDESAPRMDNELKKTQWLELAAYARPVIIELDRDEDWTDDQIWEYHANTARFMHCYCDLLPDSNITSYIHMIGAGHLTYYLLKHRNLARFQQQGWEAMMKLVHHYYYNNTNHGGSRGNSNGAMLKGDHCLPIMKLFRRRIMWHTGHGDIFFGAGPEELEEPEERDPFVGADPLPANAI